MSAVSFGVRCQCKKTVNFVDVTTGGKKTEPCPECGREYVVKYNADKCGVTIRQTLPSFIRMCFKIR